VVDFSEKCFLLLNDSQPRYSENEGSIGFWVTYCKETICSFFFSEENKLIVRIYLAL